MKTKILYQLMLVSSIGFSQDTLPKVELHSQIFSLSPISKKVDKVNGLAFGIGHFDGNYLPKQTVNGINTEISPLIIVLPYYAIYSFASCFKKIDKEVNFESITESKIKINGLNISTGGFIDRADLNGINISTFTFIQHLNGVSTSAGITAVYKLNGLSFAINNNIKFQNGLCIGLINKTHFLNGLQIGIYNRCFKSQKGIQLGVWNKNCKRSLPLINW